MMLRSAQTTLGHAVRPRTVAHLLARLGVSAASLIALALTLTAPVALASFGVEEKNFEAGTCTTSTCKYATIEANPSEAFTQAAGHPPVGITGFEFNHTGSGSSSTPEGAVKRLRVDLPPGLAADPQTLPMCTKTAFEANACSSSTQVGEDELIIASSLGHLSLTAPVYNLQPPPGMPLYFGIHVSLLTAVDLHLYLEGHVSWGNDYHEYFELNNIPKETSLAGMPLQSPLLKSTLIFNGHAGAGDFLTLPSECSTSTTSTLEVESWEGAVAHTQTHTPVGVSGCEKVPFAPVAEVKPETSQSDSPDGATAVVRVAQHAAAGEINSSSVKGLIVTLPEGMTLNPPAAKGLETCSPTQIAIGSEAAATCPTASSLGTVAIETPDLPAGSLTGNVYLGDPSGGPLSGPPYAGYLNATSAYGVTVRLQGSVEANPETGRLTATFSNTPELPFSSVTVKFRGGSQAPLANPLACSAATTGAVFTPYANSRGIPSNSAFTPTGCASPLGFAPTQSTASSTPAAGAHTVFTVDLARAEGQQYLAQLATTLPEGLLGAIPSVALCEEPQAAAGTCAAASQIGTATVTAGSGAEPYAFEGPAFLTGPYNSAPYGLSIAVPADAGPFQLGTVVTRAAITVNPYTARITVGGSLPTIVKGIPVRLRNVSIAVDRPNFLTNPTNCGMLATESALTSTLGATAGASSPLQATNCGALAFKPSLKASTREPKSRLEGASLKVDVVQAHGQANIASVAAQLPLQLPTRLSTLQYACAEATFASNPASCPSTAIVGSADVVTPVLPGVLKGHAYLVSHGGAAFPNLDVALEDGGVHLILTSTTNISKGVTTSTFTGLPDAPLSSFALDLPTGRDSVLAANGAFCAKPLAMPTTITAQNGLRIVQNTVISVTGCAPTIVGHRIAKHRLYLKIETHSTGRLTVSGRYLHTVSREIRKPGIVTMAVPLSAHLVETLRTHRRVRVAVSLALKPAAKGAPRFHVPVKLNVTR